MSRAHIYDLPGRTHECVDFRRGGVALLVLAAHGAGTEGEVRDGDALFGDDPAVLHLVIETDRRGAHDDGTHREWKDLSRPALDIGYVGKVFVGAQHRPIK